MPDMAESTSDITGLLPHRACRNCMQIKVKCIPHCDQGGSQRTCERCHRLGKTCTTPAPVGRKKRAQKASKVAQLEDRINQLSTLLTPIPSPDGTLNTTWTNTIRNSSDVLDNRQEFQRHASHDTISAGEPRHPPSYLTSNQNEHSHSLTLPPTENREHVSTLPVNCSDESLSSIIAPPHLLNRDHTKVTPAEICPMYVDPVLEAKLFDNFRQQFAVYLPFVPIPSAVKAETVKQERPFVFWCALAVSSFTRRDLHYALNEQLLKCISEQLLCKSHKSLDALQGLLILLNWYHYYSHMKPQTVNLAHLASALTIDLGFTRPSHTRQTSRITTDMADLHHGKQVLRGVQSSDDRRALLGVFWSISRLSLCFPRIEPLRFTQHMDSCCQDLETAMEFPADAWIVQMTRLHQIVGKYHSCNYVHSELPLQFLKVALTRDLDEFAAGVSTMLPGRTEVLLELEGCKFCLLGPTRPGNNASDLQSAELLYTSLRAISNFTDILVACSPEQYISLTFWYYLVHMIGALAEMCFLHADSWDLESVRQNFSFATIMLRHVDKLEECRAWRNDVATDDVAARFSLYAEKMRRCVKWYETKVDFEKQKPLPADVMIAEQNLAENMSTVLFEDLNDPIWDSIMGDWTSSLAEM